VVDYSICVSFPKLTIHCSVFVFLQRTTLSL
jgi:hypothetical protein